jgi:hypothetical protein
MNESPKKAAPEVDRGGPMRVDVAEVNRLLTASRAAHDAKKRSAGVIDRDGRVLAPPDYPSAEQHIVEALRLRLEAHALDPAHTASGWSADKAPDDKLIAFYVAYSKPFIPEKDMHQVLARFPAYAEIRYIP